jgi:hypothetical protein
VSEGTDRRVEDRVIVFPSKIRPLVRTVALPAEHGGWSFVLEPVVLALAVAPSAGGACLGLAALALFLTRQPLRLVVGGAGPLSLSNRRGLALAFLAIYGAAAVAGVVGGVMVAGKDPLWALLCASPAALVFLAYDIRKRYRRLAAELAGPAGLAAAAPAVAIAGGWGWSAAWVLWILITARAIPSVFYVRSRLQHSGGRRAPRLGVAALHVVSIAVVAWLATMGLAPMMTVGALVVLAVRAAWGLRGQYTEVRVTRLGVLEVLYGVIYVSSTVAGYRWGL